MSSGTPPGQASASARLERLSHALAACKGALHPLHTRVLRLTEAAASVAIDAGLWGAALPLVAALVEAYRAVYPPRCVHIYI